MSQEQISHPPERWWQVSIDRPFDSVFYKDRTPFKIINIFTDEVRRDGRLRNPGLKIIDKTTGEITSLSFKGDFTGEQLLEQIRQNGYLISNIRQ